MANGEERKLQSAEERIAQLEFDVEVLKSAVLRACHAAEPAWSKLDAVDVFWKSVRPSAGPTPFGMAEFVVGEVRSVDADALDIALSGIRTAVTAYDETALAQLLGQAVPEFSPVHRDPVDGQVIVPFPGRRSHRR